LLHGNLANLLCTLLLTDTWLHVYATVTEAIYYAVRLAIDSGPRKFETTETTAQCSGVAFAVSTRTQLLALYLHVVYL
jgi:hypothetical protein